MPKKSKRVIDKCNKRLRHIVQSDSVFSIVGLDTGKVTGTSMRCTSELILLTSLTNLNMVC